MQIAKKNVNRFVSVGPRMITKWRISGLEPLARYALRVPVVDQVKYRTDSVVEEGCLSEYHSLANFPRLGNNVDLGTESPVSRGDEVSISSKSFWIAVFINRIDSSH